jgi:hypothetical protein
VSVRHALLCESRPTFTSTYGIELHESLLGERLGTLYRLGTCEAGKSESFLVGTTVLAEICPEARPGSLSLSRTEIPWKSRY